jgi:hypothetical protein
MGEIDMNIEVSPEVAQAARSTRSEVEARAERSADSLKWIAKAEGDVYLNIERSFYEGPLTEFCRELNPANGRNVEMHSGPNAAAHARDMATDSSDDGHDPKPGYLTTIVLHPDGTWSEKYLFRL